MFMRAVAVLTAALLAASATEAKERYFRVTPLDKSQRLDDFAIARYSKHLEAMDEPSLSVTIMRAETYRLLWLRSFNAPMMFRLTIKPDGASELLTKKTGGKGGYEPGKLVKEAVVRLDKRDTEIFLTALKKVKFWHLPSQKEGVGFVGMGFDGARWALEGVKDGKYHVVDRWDGGEIKGWALSLMKKSGEDLEPIY